ncbi:VOC family protein [Streptomyces sp. NPDC059696]|uniref:VOC family protein n=1 Tax=Streptomyces sp. NPDC059696 TaxID=3346911 RepID=UPI0036A67451
MSKVPRTRLYAYLSYVDAAAALEWLTALGFTITTRHEGPGGDIVHAEVRRDEVALMVTSAEGGDAVPSSPGGSGLYLCLADAGDVDDWYHRAVGAGAREVIPPEDTPWGGRRARVLDPEGHEWSAGTYEPGRS